MYSAFIKKEYKKIHMANIPEARVYMELTYTATWYRQLMYRWMASFLDTPIL